MSQYLNRMYGSNPDLQTYLDSTTKIDAEVRSLIAQLKLFCSFKEKNKFQYLHRLNRNQRFALRFFTSSTSFVKDFSFLRFSCSEAEKCHASRRSFR